MTPLDKKLWREVLDLRWQVLSMASVVAIGISLLIASLSSYNGLARARSDFYRTSRFSQVFAVFKQAPLSLLGQIESIQGVRRAEGRIIREVLLNIPGLTEPATGRLISIPPGGQSLNILYPGTGRLPEAASEVIVNEAFAEANNLSAGGSLNATINGRSYTLKIVGTALSPEYIFAFRGSNPMPDNQHFGILWLPEKLLAGAYDMQGSFNDLAIMLDGSRSEEVVIQQVDTLLEPHGGTGAYGRSRQISHMFLNDEINQLRATAIYMPLIFLGVSAFLLHVVIGRLIARQREIIATLRALGYTALEIVLHYAKLIGLIVLIGFIPGVALGAYMGGGWTALYQEFYRFPTLKFQMGIDVLVASLLAALLAAVAGGGNSLREIIRLDPAQAMRPPMPPDFRHGLLDRLGILKLLSARLKIALRLLIGRPLRTAFSVVGMSFAVMIMIIGLFWMDAIDYMLDLQFNFLDRSSAALSLDRPVARRTLEEIRSLPGVIKAEGYRSIGVRLFYQNRSKITGITGLSPDTVLRRVLDKDYRVLKVPENGLLMNKHMAQKLGLSRGEELFFQLLEKDRRIFRTRLVETVEELLGSGVYMNALALNQLLDEEGLISSASVRLDPHKEEEFMARVKTYPGISSVSLRSTSLRLFEENMQRMIVTFVLILVILASAIAVGIVYNTAIVTLSEQLREFGTLRVLGFHRKEVFGIFLFELMALLLMALPLGMLFGYYGSLGLLALVPTEAFNIPLVISPQTYLYSCLVEVGAAILTLGLVWRKIKTMDFMSVLKLRE